MYTPHVILCETLQPRHPPRRTSVSYNILICTSSLSPIKTTKIWRKNRVGTSFQINCVRIRSYVSYYSTTRVPWKKCVLDNNRLSAGGLIMPYNIIIFIVYIIPRSNGLLYYTPIVTVHVRARKTVYPRTSDGWGFD